MVSRETIKRGGLVCFRDLKNTFILILLGCFTYMIKKSQLFVRSSGQEEGNEFEKSLIGQWENRYLLY